MQTILVIDDEPEIRDRVSQVLQYERYRTIIADDGQTGIHLARQYMPDLIICDVLMPGISGYGVLETLQKDRLTHAIPFIFLTGIAEKQDIRYGMNLGADDFLAKPFEIDDLLTTVRTRLEKHVRESKQIDDLRLHLSRFLPHELRTPLTAILGLTDCLLRLDPTDLPDLREILHMQQSINDSARRLERLVENYLLYAQLRLLEYDADQRRTWQTVEPIPTSAAITFLLEQKAEEVQRQEDVSMDLVEANVPIAEEHLWKITRELLDNAFKFSEPGTPIRVTTRTDEQQWMLTISDQGQGMIGEQIDDVGAYMQFGREQYEQQGNGLGLVISRMLTELYGGELWIESTPTQGTTVNVRLLLGISITY